VAALIRIERAGLQTDARHDALSMLVVEPPRLLVREVHLSGGDGLDIARTARPR
jgi:hypothetical protein